SVGVAVRRNGHADAGGKQAMGFASAVLSDHGEDHFARVKKLQAGGAGYELAVWRKNRGNPDQILSGDACVPQGQLEGSQALAMLTHSLGKEDPLRDHVLAQFICLQKYTRVAR